MAIITVSYSEALPLLSKSLTKDNLYKFKDISNVLELGFPEINSNQISGLINKLANNGVFKKIKKKGERIDYKYLGNSICVKNGVDIKGILETEFDAILEKLRAIKVDIETVDDFSWIQKKIEAIEKLKNEK